MKTETPFDIFIAAADGEELSTIQKVRVLRNDKREGLMRLGTWDFFLNNSSRSDEVESEGS